MKKKLTVKEKKTTKPAAPINGSLSQVLAQRKSIQQKDFKPKIAVIGVGGGGGNILNNLIKIGLDEVVTIACNTDAQALEKSLASVKIQLGPELTKGHGAGANNNVGKAAAEESEAEIKKHLEEVHMAFIIACMGGGTGTGAAEVIGKIALELGVLTLGFATTPFDFEGLQRKNSANEGLNAFQNNSDVLVVFGNQNLFSLSTEETTFLSAFAMTDEVLCKGIQSVVCTISNLGLINTDMADFFTIMKGRKSRARMGTGMAEGTERGLRAAQEAMSSPLLELGGMISKDVDGVIICIKCGEDISLNDITQAVGHVRESVAEGANIIFGAIVDPALVGKMQVSVFATSTNGAFQKEQEVSVSEFNKTEHTVLKVDSFQELIAEDIEIGRSHNEILHEDNLNKLTEHTFAIAPEKKSFVSKFLGLFKKDKKDDIPPYFK